MKDIVYDGYSKSTVHCTSSSALSFAPKVLVVSAFSLKSIPPFTPMSESSCTKDSVQCYPELQLNIIYGNEMIFKQFKKN